MCGDRMIFARCTENPEGRGCAAGHVNTQFEALGFWRSDKQ